MGKFVDAWNPEFGWQLLRRSESYSKAVAQFLRRARRAKDKAALNLWKVLSNEDTSESDRKGRLRRKSGFLMCSDVDLMVYGLDRDECRATYGVDPRSSHLQRFLAQFGDVLRFPIPAETNRPDAELLDGLWNLRPAAIVDDGRVEIRNKERFNDVTGLKKEFPWAEFDTDPKAIGRHFQSVQLNLEINCNFSDGEILDWAKAEIIHALREIRANGRTELCVSPKGKPETQLSDRAVRWGEFERYLEIWDHTKGINGREKLSLQRIGQKFNAPGSAENQKDWARTRVKYIDELLLFFERPRT